LTRRLKHVAWPSGRNEMTIRVKGQIEIST